MQTSFAPELESPRRAVRATANSGAAYDGASQSRRLIGWRAPTIGPNASTLPHLTTLRDRSRSAARNNPFAKSAIDKDVSNLVGTGIKPLAIIEDEALRKDVHALWDQWTQESDADGLLDFYGQEGQATRCTLEGGESFGLLRPRLESDGLSVPLQLQLVEPELCPLHHNTVTPTGSRVRAGIEFSPIGKRLAFYFHPSRPGHPDDFDESQLRRFPADAVIHLYDPRRAGQLRGIPNLSSTLVKLFELDKFDDATLLRQQLANLFAGFISRPADTTNEPIHPLTGQTAPAAGNEDRPALTLEPGIMQELDPGEEIVFSEPPGTSNGYKDFMRQQLLAVAAGTGVPYEVLSGDLSGLNDRVVRVILNEYRRRLQAFQHQILAHMFCRRVWRAWIEAVWHSNVLPIPLAYVMNPRAKWIPQGWPYIHPVQDVQSKRDAMRAGLTSRSAEVSETGEDAEQIDLEQSADNTRADKLGLQYDSDGRHPLNAKEPAGAGVTR